MVAAQIWMTFFLRGFLKKKKKVVFCHFLFCHFSKHRISSSVFLLCLLTFSLSCSIFFLLAVPSFLRGWSSIVKIRGFLFSRSHSPCVVRLVYLSSSSSSSRPKNIYLTTTSILLFIFLFLPLFSYSTTYIYIIWHVRCFPDDRHISRSHNFGTSQYFSLSSLSSSAKPRGGQFSYFFLHGKKEEKRKISSHMMMVLLIDLTHLMMTIRMMIVRNEILFVVPFPGLR